MRLIVSGFIDGVHNHAVDVAGGIVSIANLIAFFVGISYYTIMTKNSQEI